MCCPWYGLSLLIAALNYILCLIADARALFKFIIQNSFSKYIFADKMTDELRYTQITGSSAFHQLLFFFSWQTDCKQSDIVHISHSFHLYVKVIEERMNRVVRALFRQGFRAEIRIIISPPNLCRKGRAQYHFVRSCVILLHSYIEVVYNCSALV